MSLLQTLPNNLFQTVPACKNADAVDSPDVNEPAVPVEGFWRAPGQRDEIPSALAAEISPMATQVRNLTEQQQEERIVAEQVMRLGEPQGLLPTPPVAAAASDIEVVLVTAAAAMRQDFSDGMGISSQAQERYQQIMHQQFLIQQATIAQGLEANKQTVQELLSEKQRQRTVGRYLGRKSPVSPTTTTPATDERNDGNSD